MIFGDSKHKINVDLLIKEFQISNSELLANYLHELWADLSAKSSEKYFGIPQITFANVNKVITPHSIINYQG